MTETLAISSVSDGGDFNTVGKPLPNIKIQISKNSEILVNSPAMTSGYLDKDMPLQLENGWFHTKDVGIIDKNGNLKIFGRIDDMIIRGGNNIYPLEIERVIEKYPGVLSSAVIGIPDSIYGEKIVAFVVPIRGSGLKKESMKKFLQDYLPIFKVPDEIIFIESIPRTESGKIIKKTLRETYKKLLRK